MIRYIEVRLKMVGFHQWKDAPDVCGFLQAIHRHTFIFRLRVRVDHNDRNVEFTHLRQDMMKTIVARYHRVYDGWAFGERSCEELASLMMCDLSSKYNVLESGVSEDEEFEGGVIDA